MTSPDLDEWSEFTIFEPRHLPHNTLTALCGFRKIFVLDSVEAFVIDSSCRWILQLTCYSDMLK